MFSLSLSSNSLIKLFDELKSRIEISLFIGLGLSYQGTSSSEFYSNDHSSGVVYYPYLNLNRAMNSLE